LDGTPLLFAQSNIVARLEHAFDALSHRSTYLEPLYNAVRDVASMNEVSDVLNVPDVAEAA